MPPRSPFFIVPTQGLSRRRFVQGLAAGGVLAGLSTPAFKAFAQQGSATRGAAPVLKGTEFDLVIAESPVNFTGKPGVATTINGSLPAPTLRWREGDTVTIRVTNKLREACLLYTSITVPWATLLVSVGLYIVIPVILAQFWRRALLSKGQAAFDRALERIDVYKRQDTTWPWARHTIWWSWMSCCRCV